MSGRQFNTFHKSHQKRLVKAKTDEDLQKLEEDLYNESSEEESSEEESSEEESSEEETSETETSEDVSSEKEEIEDDVKEKHNTENIDFQGRNVQNMEYAPESFDADNPEFPKNDELTAILNTLLNNFLDCEEDICDSDFYEEYYSSDSDASYYSDIDSDASNQSDNDDNTNKNVEEMETEDESVITEECLISKNCPLKSKLKPLANKLTREDTAELLKILYDIGHHELPADRRSLLGTPRVTKIIPCEEGEYFHYGLKEGILDILKRFKNLKRKLKIDIGIDGLPLSSSSNQKLWPILGKIKGVNKIPPFLIGAYFGSTEPEKASPFLDSLINEYEKLKKDNITYDGNIYEVQINVIICDIPAACKVTCTKYYTGYYGCRKCMVKGKRYKKKTIFLRQNKPLRTDENFRNREQKKHHAGTSPFEKTEINMVKSIPIDYMHAVCIGVMKLLLKIWFRGDFKKKVKPMFNLKIMEKVSNLFLSFGKFMPKEFNRKPQSLSELGRWKATVLRYFLLYAGPVILKDILPKDLYEHFCLFSCAIRLLCDPIHCKTNNEHANKLLRKFVKQFESKYGKQYITINVHSLIHLAQEVINNDGPLDTFSAFEFENHMQFLKKILRKRRQPLQQIHRRLKEGRCPKKQQRVETATLKTPLKRILAFNCVQSHKRLALPTVEFSIDSPNNCCILKDNIYIIITKIGKLDGKPVLIGKKFNKVEDLEGYPVRSSEINTCIISDLSNNEEVFPSDRIVAKACLFLHNNHCYATKLLHS